MSDENEMAGEHAGRDNEAETSERERNEGGMEGWEKLSREKERERELKKTLRHGNVRGCCSARR